MKKRKIVRSIMFIAILGIMIFPNKARAVTLQSNGGTPAPYTINDMLLYVREMQKTGGALGLTDTINDNLTSTNK